MSEMAEIRIDSDVPLPPARRLSEFSRFKRALRELEQGQSLVHPGPTYARAYTCAWHALKSLNREWYMQREFDESGAPVGWRIWRKDAG